MAPLGARGLEAVEFVRTFDPLPGGMILAGAEPDGQGPAGAAHRRMLRSVPHVIEITVDGRAVAVAEPRDLAVAVAQDVVTYRFAVPLLQPVVPPCVVDIHLDNPGLFAAFTPQDPRPAEVRTSGLFSADCARTRRPSGAPGPLRCTLRR